MLTPEHQAALASAVVQTCNTSGWPVVLTLAENIVGEFEAKALDCDDETLVVGLQRKARVAREFYNTFVNRVDTLRYSVTAADPSAPKEFDSDETSD